MRYIHLKHLNLSIYLQIHFLTQQNGSVFLRGMLILLTQWTQLNLYVLLRTVLCLKDLIVIVNSDSQPKPERRLRRS